MKKDVVIEKEWKDALRDFFGTETFVKLTEFVRNEYAARQVFPPPKDIFRAFTLTPFSQVKVVILGQDPYHDSGQACGLCFSVPPSVSVPPSLKNIYKEIESDCAIKKDFKNDAPKISKIFYQKIKTIIWLVGDVGGRVFTTLEGVWRK
jgi:uracil-DNA glycosylase